MKKATQYMAVIAALATAASVSAVPTLYMSDGVNSLTVTDGGAVIAVGAVAGSVVDANGAAGAVTWIGSIGVWSVNVSTGTTDPVTTPPYPHLDLNSINSSTAGSTLTIRWTDTGFTATSGHAQLAIGGTLGGGAGSSIIYNAFGSAANAVPANGGTLLGTLAFNTPGAFSGTLNGGSLAPLGNNFSITEEVIIRHGAAGGSSFNAELLNVPEGGATLILLGSGLTALAFLRRRASKA